MNRIKELHQMFPDQEVFVLQDLYEQMCKSPMFLT